MLLSPINLGLLASLSVPVLCGPAASMESGLIGYRNQGRMERMSQVDYHYGPGTLDFTSSSMQMGWNVSTTDVASWINRIYLPMDISGHGKVYYTLDSITLSGWLDLEPGSNVKEAKVEIVSDLSGDGSPGGALAPLATESIVPREGSDSSGYNGPFRTSMGVNYNKEVANGEKNKLCSGSVEDWTMALFVHITMSPYHSRSVRGTMGRTADHPLELNIGVSWHDC